MVLWNLKKKFLSQPHDEELLTKDPRYKHYKANKDCIIPKDGLLPRKYFGETDSVKYTQILILKQLVNEELWSLHREFGKHPGTIKQIIAYGEQKILPKMVQMIRKWVVSCEQGIKELRIDCSLNRFLLHNLNENIAAPDDAMHIYLVPESTRAVVMKR